MSFYGKCESGKQMKAIKRANYLVPLILASIIGVNHASSELTETYEMSNGINNIEDVKSGIFENCSLDLINTDGESIFCKINNGEYKIKFDSELFNIDEMEKNGFINHQKYGKAIEIQKETKSEYMHKPLNYILSSYYNYVFEETDVVKNKNEKYMIYKLGNIDDQKRLDSIIDIKEQKVFTTTKTEDTQVNSLKP